MLRMKTRRVIGLGVAATAAIWMQVAARYEARRIDDQRQARAPVTTPPAALRIDSERLMATIQALTEPRFAGRRTGSPGGVAARAWIADRFRSLGLQPVSGRYVFPFHFTHFSIKGIVDPARDFKTEFTDAANVVGQCLGDDLAAPVVVVSAHYDHLGTRDGVTYPGADDNASGVAVMLELAARCHQTPFQHTLVFAAFDAEELGMQGSKAFLIAPPLPKERIGLNVNLDMVSRSDRRELFAAGTYQWPMLKPPLEAVAREAPVTLLFGHDKPMSVAGGVEDWTGQSDHGSFEDAGIPFVYFGVEDHADYHQPTDTADKIQRGFLVDVAETILDALSALDHLALAPRQR